MNELTKTYTLAQELINKSITTIKNESFQIHSENQEVFMMLLVAITKFIMIKPEIVYKNKKEKKLYELYPLKQLNDIVFNGRFKIINTPISTNFTIYKEKPILITKIRPGYEKNSIWIIDTIRDSLAHNHFKFDYQKQSIHIENNRKDRLLTCDIDFYWIIEFSFLLSTNRVENNNKKITLSPKEEEYKPTITSIEDLKKIKCEQPINNIDDVEKLLDTIFIYSYNIKLKDSLTNEETQKIKMNINRIWQKELPLFEKMWDRKYQEDHEYYIKQNLEEIQNKYGNKIETIERVTIPKEILKKYLEQKLKEINNFYQLEKKIKKEIIIKLLKTKYYYIANNTNLIEFGLDTLMSIDFGQNNKLAIDYYNQNGIEYITNIHCYRKEKLISLLYLKGVINFALFKEKIYDKNVDYDLFDLSKFEIYDYGIYGKIEKQLIEKRQMVQKTYKSIKETLKKITKYEEKQKHNPEKIHELINKEKDNLQKNKKILKQLDYEISILEEQLNSSIKEYYEGYHSKISSKEFFRHLRNALAHTWMEYDDSTYTNLMNRIVEIKDYNDKGEITYICRSSYKNWLELLNSHIFTETIESYDSNFQLRK